jgi:hypothetical protein
MTYYAKCKSDAEKFLADASFASIEEKYVQTSTGQTKVMDGLSDDGRIIERVIICPVEYLTASNKERI